MYIYHGTTVENARKIIENGWKRKESSIPTWLCSDPHSIYFAYSKEDEREAARMAFEAGVTAATVQKSQESSIVLFRMEVPEEMLAHFDDYLDYSCDNMWYSAVEIPVEIIEENKDNIEMIEIDHAFVPSLSLAYLSVFTRQGYLNLEPLTEMEMDCFEDSNFSLVCEELESYLMELGTNRLFEILES